MHRIHSSQIDCLMYVEEGAGSPTQSNIQASKTSYPKEARYRKVKDSLAEHHFRRMPAKKRQQNQKAKNQCKR